MSLLAVRPVFDDPLQTALYETLCMDALGIDALSERLQHDTAVIINALAMMEIE